jgi:uncharacterized protein involved in exopolysaccharide biosynthesis
MTGSQTNEKNLPVVGGNQFNFRAIIFTLYRRKWLILAVAVPIILMGGAGLFNQSGMFTAQSMVIVELKRVDLPIWNATKGNVDYDRELSTMSNVAMSIPVLQAAAVALEDSVATILELDPLLQEIATFDDWLLGYLFDGLSVGIVGESRILDFKFTSTHPRISLMCVGALSKSFLHYSVYGQKNAGAVSYYGEQTSVVRAEIDSLLGVRSDILKESGYISLVDELRYNTGQLSDLESKLFKVRAERQALEVEYNLTKAFLKGDPRDFPMGAQESRSHSLIYWRNLVSKHEDALHSIQSVYNEDSMPVVRQKELLDKALKSLRREQENFVSSMETLLMFAKENEAAQARTLKEKRAESANVPELYQKVSLLDSEISSLNSLLEDLQGKWGEVRINQLADDRVSNVVPLTSPELIESYSGGQTMVYFLMVVFFGLALGFVVAFVVESMDHRLYVPLDVENHLQLPVFASVSKE